MKNLHQIKNTTIPLWVRQLYCAWIGLDKDTVLAYNPQTKKCGRNNTHTANFNEKTWREDLGWGQMMDFADLNKYDPDKVRIIIE